jgi:5,10-methylenetetrahydromethanopterin reductase
LEIGISFAGVYHLPDYFKQIVRIVKSIDRSGFAHAWQGDSQMLHRDVFAELAIWAEATKKIRLGPCVTNPYTRHPSVTASAIATINELSDGRALLGIGTGDSSVRRVGAAPSSLQELELAVKEIRKLLAGVADGGESGLMKIRWIHPRKIPILVAGAGPKSLRLAGKIGDGVITLAGGSASAFEIAKKHIEAGVRASGRSLENVAMIGFLFSTVSDDRTRARELARPFLVWFSMNIPNHPMLAEKMRDPAFRKKTEEFRRDYLMADEKFSHHTSNWDEAVKASSFMSDELVDSLAVSGNPEDVVRKIRDLERVGVKECILRIPQTASFEDDVKMIAEHVIPAFR